jgi:hypothetical protein
VTNQVPAGGLAGVAQFAVRCNDEKDFGCHDCLFNYFVEQIVFYFQLIEVLR